MAVARKTVRRKKPTARTGRRKSTAAPKRIINRKKQTTRKKATARTPKPDREATAKAKLAAQSKLGHDVKTAIKSGLSIKDASAELGVTVGQARVALRKASVKPTDRIVGSEAEVARAVVKARKAGVSFPDLRARTGLSGPKLRAMVEAAGGNGARPARKAAAKAKPARKSAAARKAEATKGKASPRARRSKAKADATEDAAPSGRQKGRRARRVELMTFLRNVIWDLDSDNDEVAEGLLNHTIEVTRDFNGRPVKPTEHKVVEVTQITMHDKEGRVIEFIDDGHQTRYVSSREITALK